MNKTRGWSPEPPSSNTDRIELDLMLPVVLCIASTGGAVGFSALNNDGPDIFSASSVASSVWLLVVAFCDSMDTKVVGFSVLWSDVATVVSEDV